MAGSFGGSIKLTGESEYTKALKTITSNLSVMASEMKLVSAQYSSNDKSIEALTSRNNVLNKQIEEGKKKVDVYRSALEDFKTQQDKNGASIMELMVKLESEKKKLQELKSSTTATSDEIKAQEKVVASLSSELADSEAQYEKNKLSINKYQTQLNGAEAEVVKMTKELNSNNELLEKTEKGMDEASDSVDDFKESEKDAGRETITLGDLIKGNLISEGIIAGIKGLANAMKSVASGLVNLGKEAIKNYADYEQLVGGVETLFKDSANVVEEYANNAYKTAGLSANEYMETVTSFSASLLQSLDGDTAKVAEVSNMAVTDMADNANKMGTNISMIQSAYQGFAKQNYTMLDNLKLGYGGTKTEMERLLADAEKISGVKYDIKNLNDVYQAIHVIQKEMDISGYSTEQLQEKLKNMSLTEAELTKVAKDMGISYEDAMKKMKDGTLTTKDAQVLLGTTAREASVTISGSANAMKSAWQNLLTGIADDNANFESLIGNFVDSILTFADNIVPRIEATMDGLVNLILGVTDTLLPKVLDIAVNLVQNLVTGISNNIGSLMSAINQVITTVLNALISMLPQILQTGIQIIVSLITGIAQQLPTLIPQIVEAVILMVDTLIDNIDLIIDAGIQLIIGLADGLIQALPILIDKIPVIIDKLINAIIENLPKIIEMGITLIIKLAEGLIKAIPQLISKVPQIITSLLNAITGGGFSKMLQAGKDLLNKVKDGIASGISKIADVGKNLVQGLWNGINNAKDWVLGKIKGFGKSILNGIKSFFGIHSPSTVFKDEIGSNLALGIGEGFEDEMKNVSDMMDEAIPKDFDVGVNTNYDGVNIDSNTYSKDILVEAFKEALDGMTFKAFDETFGELVVDKVEKVVYS
jgi:phage-related protein